MKKCKRIFLSALVAISLGLPEASKSGQIDKDNPYLVRKRSKIAKQIEKGEIISKKLLIYTVKPITNERILPDSTSIPGKLSDILFMSATPGEYEPASFVIRANEDIKGLELSVSDLKSRANKRIASSAIDMKVIKCWYQDEGRGYQEQTPTKTYNPVPLARKKVLLPELLLNDDSLIRVDAEEKHNYLKTSDKGEVKYLIISSEKKGEGVSGVSAIPVNDSSVLLPVDIKKDTNKQFWVTVKVPEGAAGGIYKGKLRLKTKGEILGVITLNLKVLPFKLSEAYYTSSIYYHSPKAKFHRDRSAEQFKRETENMYAHGVTNPAVSEGIGKLNDSLKIRSKVGINSKSLFYLGLNTGSPTSPEQLESLKNRIKKVVEIARPYGIEDVHVYGIDEGINKGVEHFTSQRPAWEAVHQAGGKIFVAGVKVNFYKDERKVGNFGAMGDIQDIMVAYGYPNREEAARWHSKGHKVLCYANPQSGMEQPDTYRRNFGLLLWQYDYDGAMTYVYRWAWGDFCRKNYKQHNMVYATVDGVIDTIQWEGYREGVDDIRYLTTLLDTVEEAEKSKDPKIKDAVSEAKNYLKRLKDNDVNKAGSDLDIIRSEMISYILKLTEKRR